MSLRDRRRGGGGGFSLVGAGGVYQARNSGSPILPASAAVRIANAIDASYLGFSSLRLNQASVDAAIDAIYQAVVADANHYTAATPIVLQIGGSGGLINAAPSGTYQYSASPTTGMEKIYYLNYLAAHAWAIIFTGGIAEASLLGNVIGSGEKTWEDTAGAANRLNFQSFVAVPGSIVDIRLKCVGNCNSKVAIYSNSAGYPADLLAYSDSIACVAGWNTIKLNTQIPLTTATYWLVFKLDATNMYYRKVGSGSTYYANDAYNNAFGATAPIGMTFLARDNAIAGYGVKTI